MAAPTYTLAIAGLLAVLSRLQIVSAQASSYYQSTSTPTLVLVNNNTLHVAINHLQSLSSDASTAVSIPGAYDYTLSVKSTSASSTTAMTFPDASALNWSRQENCLGYTIGSPRAVAVNDMIYFVSLQLPLPGQTLQRSTMSVMMTGGTFPLCYDVANVVSTTQSTSTPTTAVFQNRQDVAMVYSSGLGRVLVFGGKQWSLLSQNNDTASVVKLSAQLDQIVPGNSTVPTFISETATSVQNDASSTVIPPLTNAIMVEMSTGTNGNHSPLVLVLGGCDQIDAVSGNITACSPFDHYYQIETNTSTTPLSIAKVPIPGADIPSPRQGACYTVIPSMGLFLYGGNDLNNTLSDAWLLSSTSMTWTRLAFENGQSDPRQNHGCEYIGGSIIVVGGSASEQSWNDLSTGPPITTIGVPIGSGETGATTAWTWRPTQNGNANSGAPNADNSASPEKKALIGGIIMMAGVGLLLFGLMAAILSCYIKRRKLQFIQSQQKVADRAVAERLQLSLAMMFGANYSAQMTAAIANGEYINHPTDIIRNPISQGEDENGVSRGQSLNLNFDLELQQHAADSLEPLPAYERSPSALGAAHIPPIYGSPLEDRSPHDTVRTAR